jgi:hypothetical protein
VINTYAIASSDDAHDVKAHGVEVWLVFGEVLFGERADGGLLTCRYGFEWVAEARRAAEFHFYEDEGFIVADYEVNFAAALPVVAFDEPVTASGKVAQREVLAPRAGRLACQPPTPA